MKYISCSKYQASNKSSCTLWINFGLKSSTKAPKILGFNDLSYDNLTDFDINNPLSIRNLVPSIHSVGMWLDEKQNAIVNLIYLTNDLLFMSHSLIIVININTISSDCV